MGELENITYKERVKLGMFSSDTKRSYNNLKLHVPILLTTLLFAVFHIHRQWARKSGLELQVGV